MTKHYFYLWAAVLLFSGWVNTAQAQQTDKSPQFDCFNFAFHKFFFDISSDEQSIWQPKEHDCAPDLPDAIMQAFAEVPKYSQSHFTSMLKSNTRLGVFTLTVPEKQYFMASGMDADNFNKILPCVAGFKRRTEALLSDDTRYFDEMVHHLRFLKSVEEAPFYQMGRKFQFRIIRSVKDLDEVVENPTLIGGFFNIFGAHNLSSYFYIDKNLVNSDDFKQTVRQNVERLKGQRPLIDNTKEYLDVPILFMSIAGVFRNGFGGDTRSSMVGSEEEGVFKQTIEGQEQLSGVGKDLVQQLIDQKEGRRILVNVRGLSGQARKWIYQQYSNMRYDGDTIPIMAIDVAVHGESWSDSKMDNSRENANRILAMHGDAMAREDLRNILESRGLLTISLDRVRLTKGSKAASLLAEKIDGSADYRSTAVKIILAHVFRCIHVVQSKDMWNHIGLSSSFDGANRPFLIYDTAEKLADLRKDMLDYLKNPTPLFDLYDAQDIQQFMYDYSPEEIVEKLFSSNALRVTREQLQKLEQKKSEQAAKKE